MTVTVHYMPDFEPNEYFWKHHWAEGKEEKWEAFARVVRDIISEYSGLPKSNLQMEDKFAYMKALKELPSETNKEKWRDNTRERHLNTEFFAFIN